MIVLHGFPIDGASLFYRHKYILRCFKARGPKKVAIVCERALRKTTVGYFFVVWHWILFENIDVVHIVIM